MNETVTIAKALSDESRLRAIMALHAHGELCACQLIELLGLAPPTVSRHMAILIQAGLIQGTKRGRWVYYRLPSSTADAPVQQALSWVLDSLKNNHHIEQDRETLCKIVSCSPEDLCRKQRS